MPSGTLFLNPHNIHMHLISFHHLFTSVLQAKSLRQHNLINLPKLTQLENGRSRIGLSFLPNHYPMMPLLKTVAVSKGLHSRKRRATYMGSPRRAGLAQRITSLCQFWQQIINSVLLTLKSVPVWWEGSKWR